MIRDMLTGAMIVVPMALSGCGVSGRVSTTSGGQISNSSGHVTGNIAAINVTLDVRDAGSNDAGSTHSTSSTSGPSGSTQFDRWEVTAGEVQIVFERSNDGPISLTVDDRNYGTIDEGAELLIDEQRRVFVNGESRGSQGPDSVAADPETEL